MTFEDWMNERLSLEGQNNGPTRKEAWSVMCAYKAGAAGNMTLEDMKRQHAALYPNAPCRITSQETG